MPSILTRETVVIPTGWCVVREQDDRHLIYNSRTDELHLVPPTGMFALGLCDGAATVGEIAEALAARLSSPPEVVHASVQQFFDMLLARGIVEVAA